MDLELNSTLNIACAVGNNNIQTKNSHSGLLNLPLEVFEYILPHLSAEDIYRLSNVTKQLYNLIFPPENPGYASRIWRHLNLGYSSCKRDDIKYQLEQGILRNPSVLANTRTLVLDGNRTVTTLDVTRILFGIDKFTDNNFEAWTYTESSVPRHNIQILSIRSCPRIFDSDLARALTNIGRSLTHKFTGPVRGVYYFTDPDMDGNAAETARITFLPLKRPSERHQSLWVNALKAMAGKIVFDTELCQGKTHDTDAGEGSDTMSKIASVRLATGCAGCGVCPSVEDMKSMKDSANRALVPPAPLHSSTLASACSYHTYLTTKMTLRCTDCIKYRLCVSCGKWWCLSCENTELAKIAAAANSTSDITSAVNAGPSGPPKRKGLVQMNCFECGYQCHDCSSPSSRSCIGCHSQYCTIHDHGSDETHCEWCNTTSRRRATRERRSSSSNMDEPQVPVQGSTPAENGISMILQPAVTNYFASTAYPASAATSYPGATETSIPTSAPSTSPSASSWPINLPISNATTTPTLHQPRLAKCISSTSRLSSAKLAALYPIISSPTSSLSTASHSGKPKSAIPRTLPAYSFLTEASASSPGSKSDPYQTFRAAGMRMRTMMVVNANKDGKVTHVMNAGATINGKGQGNIGSYAVVPGATMLGEGASRSGRVAGNGAGSGSSSSDGKGKGRSADR